MPHSIELLRSLSEFRNLVGNYPVLVGSSRKGFLSTLTGRAPSETQFGTGIPSRIVDSSSISSAATITAAIAQGADLVRVHDVLEMKEVVQVADAIYRNILPVGDIPQRK